MSLTIGQPAPDFVLPDLDGKAHRLTDYSGHIVVLNFWSCECPHSARTDTVILSKLNELKAGMVMLSIASNRNESMDMIRREAEARHIPCMLLDAEARVADLYHAQTTPHVFLIDRAGLLRYRGAIDDVSFRQRTPSRFLLGEALEALLEGNSPSPAETPAYGCTIVREI